MSEFHVNVVRLTNVQKHPNADSLFIAKIHGGYPIIFKGKQFGGAFEEGDLAVYIPVDSLVPATEEYAWLSPPTEVLLPGGEKQMVPATVPREKDRRVRAKRLREVFSMGMLGVAPEGTVEGQDVAELMGITKYEEPEEVINASQTDGLQVPAPRLKAMPSVYDIEGLRRYTNAFKTGEAYVVTEKLHGCVPSSALVTMADGSRKRITSVEEGDQVMGMTIEGKPTATKVLRKYDNGKAEEGWLKITGQRRNAGRGSSFFALRCTPNHKVWNATAQEYVEARNLKRDDRIVSLRSELTLTPLQEQVLLGKLLGDGCYRDTEHSAHVTWSHVSSDRDYADWTGQALGFLDSKARTVRSSGYGSDMIACRTTNSAWIKQKFCSFFAATDDKQVPEWVASELNPIALAFWYMDDGSLTHHEGQEDRASFATCAFSSDSHDVLLRALQRLGIEGIHTQHGCPSRISLNSDNAERLFLLVAPYVPRSMERKLPKRYRGHEGWLPKLESDYKSMLVEQTIDSVEVDPTVVSNRYDMETETHNYFCNGVLVHNCNARFVHDGEKLHVGSRTRWLTTEERNTWADAATRYELAGKIAQAPGLVFFGETYGNNTDMPYGVTRAKTGDEVRFFDIWDSNTGTFLDHDMFVATCTRLSLDMAPELCRGTWSEGEFEKLAPLAEGKTTLGGGHVREGFVIKPLVERCMDRSDGYIGGRLILKLHGEGFLTRKSAR